MHKVSPSYLLFLSIHMIQLLTSAPANKNLKKPTVILNKKTHSKSLQDLPCNIRYNWPTILKSNGNVYIQDLPCNIRYNWPTILKSNGNVYIQTLQADITRKSTCYGTHAYIQINFETLSLICPIHTAFAFPDWHLLFGVHNTGSSLNFHCTFT
jgi:hypothetical protein